MREHRRPRGKCRFTQSEVERAIRAAKRADLSIACVRIEADGTILIVHGEPSSVAPLEVNPWDA